MKSLKFWIKLLLYLSLGFLLYYLVQFDYLVFKNITFNYYILVASVLLLWAGFFVSTISWRIALKIHGHEVSQNLATHSHGISVFAKYIPGKLWVILGRASVACTNKSAINIYSTISLKEQLIYLFTGLLVSFIALLFIHINIYFIVIVALTAFGLGLFLFSNKTHNFSLKLFKRVFKKELDVPFIDFKNLSPIALSTLLYWTLWSIGFYLLCKAIAPDVSFMATFAFPLSVSYGLLAVFIPGGIGIREGIIVLILTATGVDITTATTISVISRLWFISGEVFIFLLALTSRKFGQSVIY